MTYLMQIFKVAVADTMLKIAKEKKAKDVKVAGELYALLMAKLEEMRVEEEIRMLEEIDLEDIEEEIKKLKEKEIEGIEETTEAEAEELIEKPKKKGSKNVK